MSTDARLRDPAIALEAGPPAAPWEPGAPRLPAEVERVLTALGGTTWGDIRFLEIPAVEPLRARLGELTAAFDARRSDVAAHALWSPDWYPIARASSLHASSSDVHAYAPLGCFRGPPGQIVCLDVEERACWEGYPSLAF